MSYCANPDTIPPPTIASTMYHEKQKLSLCGVHAINNLLQKTAFDKASFDAVCNELAPSPSSIAFWNVNPHRSALGLGNYDVNVLMVILERQGFAVKWHDVRQEISATTLEDYYENLGGKDQTAEPEICGIVVNVPSTSMWSKLTKGRHWMTLLWSDAPSVNDTNRKQDNNTEKQGFRWMNLDSELKEPEIVGDMAACAKLLQRWQESKGDCHILLVKK